jgi:hypothetical protein
MPHKHVIFKIRHVSVLPSLFSLEMIIALKPHNLQSTIYHTTVLQQFISSDVYLECRLMCYRSTHHENHCFWPRGKRSLHDNNIVMLFILTFQVRTTDMMIHNGLKVYKYIFKNGTLDNGAENPENKCFCRKNKCLTSGLVDVTDCYYGNIIK